MLKGDLASTPLAPLLRDLADDSVTGCLHVSNPEGEEALIYFKNGLVYSVSVPGTRPQLGAKLVSSGALAPEALAEALEAQREELQGWRLGELLVHLGYVDQPVVEAFVLEQVNEALWDLLRWPEGRWKFRKNIRAREDVGPPMAVVELLAALRDRGYEWENISAVVHGPSAVPVLSAGGGASAETTLDNDAWSMLCKIDGERTVADLARDCGYTLFEAGNVIVSLVQAGLVDIEEDIGVAGADLYGASTLTSALNGDLEDDADESGAASEEPALDDDSDVLTRLARLVSEVSGDTPANGESAADGSDDAAEADLADRAPALTLAPSKQGSVASFDNPMIVPLHRHSTESFAASIARVSNALSDVLGDAPDAAEAELAKSTRPVALKRGKGSNGDPEWQSRKRQRSAAAAELATAQAMVETLRADHDSSAVDDDDLLDEAPPAAEQIAAQFAAEQAEADAEQAAAQAAAQEQERLKADRVAAEQAEADRIAAEQAEADRVAAEQAEADRVAAEQAEADRIAAEQAEADRVAAEQAEIDRIAAEQAEIERLEAELAERAALEEAAWEEYWALEAEARAAAERIETERVAAEQAETERVAAEQAEAERVAAEQAEADRFAAEQAEIERLEAERLAAEQAEIERLEAERLAAEQAEIERVAAEQAEAERLAAEQAEAERIAAEQAEADRLAAELAEAERIAAEQAEADRLAAELAEAERIAAEQAEIERLAAEQADAEPLEYDVAADAGLSKSERAARRKGERQAAQETAEISDEAAAATALLVELAATEVEPVDEQPAPEVFEYPDQQPEPEIPAWTEAGQADTAALLRELSSLGMDDAPSSGNGASAPPPHKPRPVPTEKKPKKKIGLFGR